MKRVLSLLLVAVLCFTICAVPLRTEAHAIAGEAILGGIGIATIAVIASSMGVQLANQGDFRAACQGCWDGLTDAMKTVINNTVQYNGEKLILTALVQAAEFKFIWDAVKDFYFPESGNITVVQPSDTVSNPLDYTYPHVISFTNDAAAWSWSKDIIIPTSYAITHDNTWEWQGSNGSVYKLTSSFYDYDANYKGIMFLYYIDGILFDSYFVSPLGREQGAAFLTFYQSNGIKYLIAVFQTFQSSYSSFTGTDNYWRIDRKMQIPFDYLTGTDINIPVSSAPGAIPDDAVYEGWKEKSTSAGGITLNPDDVTALTEVFGDATTAEDAMTATQEKTLTQTGIKEAMEGLEFSNVEEYQTPVGWLEIFPFCIPFDLYNMVSALRSAREAPHIDWTLDVPGIVNYTFDIDFAQFETVAQVLRTMEFLVFAVGLAFVTRNLIKG